ncbi:LytTR family DNA-binding domain-containing protein [Isobaculum melis]|uniref:LytTr DNA-binding domain-containing protein n=1 Tax=Isobaculum melis TaxID=142588 RepID=A0A1H9TWB8_9LACT|nr:LytTR family DNA-binding domain-containing protein [Isobaculum melis]SES01298.1 LytTr DNA-binding domain-containing protein [Isobaculum melis]
MNITISIKEALKDLTLLIEAPTYEQAEEVVHLLKGKGTKAETLSIKTADGYELVMTNEIELIEVLGEEMTLFLLSNRQIQTKGRLYKLFEALNQRQFVQVSRSAIVNCQEIQKLENSFSGNMLAYLKSGKTTSISRRYLPQLKAKLNII